VSQPRFEVAAGAIDGVNTTFTVSVAYTPSTTAVFLNGKLYRKDWDDGWIETNPALGVVDLKEAPVPGDVIQIFFTDTAAPSLEEEVTPLHGVLMEVGELRGMLLDAEYRTASLHELGTAEGLLLEVQPMLGALHDTEVLRAQLYEVCG
jgi:hypothetical protein